MTAEPSVQYIFRPSITLKNGKRIFAANYGLKAFKIPVNGDRKEPQPDLFKKN